MTQITESNGAISMGEIEKFESTHGINLSEQYKHFLQKFNGGRPVPNMFKNFRGTETRYRANIFWYWRYER